MKRKKIPISKTIKNFQKKMQKLVDENKPEGINKITIQFGDNEPITIAEQKGRPDSPPA